MSVKNNLDEITIKRIRSVKNWKNKKAMEIAREAGITIEAVDITLRRFGYRERKSCQKIRSGGIV